MMREFEPATPIPAPAARAVHRGRLFRRYFVLILALVCGALLASSAISLYFSYEENKAALASLQKEKAIAAASRIDQFVRRIEQQLTFAALPQFGVEGGEQRRIEFLKLLRQVPAVTDIAYLDPAGREQIAISRLAMDVAGGARDRSKDPVFVGVRQDKTYFGPVYFRKETEPYMAIAVRSGAEGGSVTVADVNLKFIWDVISRIKIGEKGKAYVVDATGHLVADPDIGLVLRKSDLSALAQVKAALASGAEDEPVLLARDAAGTAVLTAWAGIAPLGWKVFVEQPVAEVYAKLDASIVRTVLLLLIGLVISALAALVLARRMVSPIRALQEGAAQIGAGKLDQRISVQTGDELEALSDQFNKMAGDLKASYAGLERKVEERTAELRETLEQQTATAEILRVISSSPTDVQPVFDAIVRNATVLCESMYANVFRYDGEMVHFVATHGWPLDALTTLRNAFPMRPNPTRVAGRVILSKQIVHVEDALADPEYDQDLAIALGSYRRILGVPMLREGNPVGVITVGWAQAGPVQKRHEELLQTFAAQAVIAIENVRLFNETKEALEQQTATASVLRVISASPNDLGPVFDSILEHAMRLCEAQSGFLYSCDGRAFDLVAHRGLEGEPLARFKRISHEQRVRGPKTALGRVLIAKLPVHIPDLMDDEGYRSRDPARIAVVELVGARSFLAVPLLKEGTVSGAIIIYRREVRPFLDKQIKLLETFADQAVIAIENVRLFNEIQDKSRQLEIASKHKSEFLANMSHELRTPLNAIIGFSEVLIEKMFGELNAKQEDYLKDIHSSGRHLLSLINDILDLSKIEAGRMELEVSDFHVPSALQNAMTLVRERAQRHNIALSLHIDTQIGDMSADERKFKQIMLNLLSNAVKFTPDGGRVEVDARLASSELEVSVKDTGVGIAKEDQAAVFEEFRQVGRHYTDKHEGTGLGLTLTRRFVEMHGGRIRLESEPGKGSTFTFTLPVRQ